MRQSLKQILLDELRTGKILSRTDVFQIAKEIGCVQSCAERRMRELGEDDFVETLNFNKKPAKRSEFVAFYKYKGTRNVWKKYVEKK